MWTCLRSVSRVVTWRLRDSSWQWGAVKGSSVCAQCGWDAAKLSESVLGSVKRGRLLV